MQARLNRVIQKKLKQASIRPKLDLGITKIPRCDVCFEKEGKIVPNPEGRSDCPRCGSPAPEKSYTWTDDTVITIPIGARFCYWMSDRLIQFSNWMRK